MIGYAFSSVTGLAGHRAGSKHRCVTAAVRLLPWLTRQEAQACSFWSGMTKAILNLVLAPGRPLRDMALALI